MNVNLHWKFEILYFYFLCLQDLLIVYIFLAREKLIEFIIQGIVFVDVSKWGCHLISQE